MAEEFCQQHPCPRRAKQVYLNTLAVCAANFCLTCLGIETDLEASDSWDPIQQTLANTAALIVKRRGILECRPVLPGEETCQVPLEVWPNRLGYLAVWLSPDLSEAKLLGLLPTVDREFVPLTQLQSLAVCLQHLRPPVQLRQWLDNIFEAGWETANSLLLPGQTEPAFQFRSARALASKSFDRYLGTIARRKTLDLELSGKQVELFVRLKPPIEEEMDVAVELRVQEPQSYLPGGLQLEILDGTGIAVMRAEARHSQTLQMEFSGELGEHFGIKVALGDVSLTEAFLI